MKFYREDKDNFVVKVPRFGVHAVRAGRRGRVEFWRITDFETGVCFAHAETRAKAIAVMKEHLAVRLKGEMERVRNAA